MRPWSSRIFAASGPSFFIVGMVLAWQGYKGAKGQLGKIEAWRVGLFLVAAMLSFVLGAIATREKYKRNRDDR